MTIKKRIEDLERRTAADEEARIDVFGIEARPSQIRATLETIWSRPPAGLPDPTEMAVESA